MCIFTSRARHWVKLYPEARDALIFLMQIPGSLSWMATIVHHIHYINSGVSSHPKVFAPL